MKNDQVSKGVIDMDDGFSLERVRMMVVLSDDPSEDCVASLNNDILYTPKDIYAYDLGKLYCRLGKDYHDGNVIEENLPKACRFLEIAYNKGCREIRPGDYLMMGMYRLLKIASVQEHEALFYLAMMYDQGIYVEEDRLMAADCINKILEDPKEKYDVFYGAAEAILACWELDYPEDIIDQVFHSLD